MDYKAKLIEKINLDYPGLEQAKALYGQGKKEACVEEIVAYYRKRTGLKYLFTRQDMQKFSDREILADADAVLHHDIYGYQFPGEIDWHFNPTADTSRDNEWSWSLFRNIYWQPLARAYVMTGNEIYAAEFAKQLRGFVEAWPAEPFLADENYAKQFTFPGHAWRTIETAMRIYTTWLPCMVAFLDSPSVDTDTWAVFLSSVADHAELLYRYYTNHSHSSNWLTMESSATLQCGILFPEMKQAKSWFKAGYQRVMHELRYSFDNDGIHMERTPIYHMVAALVYLQAYRLCALNGIAVPPYGLPTLERAAEFIMRLVKPDFTTPMIGDADRDNLLTRRSDTSVYEGMNLSFDPYDLNEMRAFFRTMYELTGRQDFLYFATGRRQGTPPEQRNYSMKQAGIFVMRTGWQPQDSYFHLHGVALERGEVSTHSHNDQGHVELQIKGEDILCDSGRYIYNSSCWKNWRHYILSAKAHNTLYMDDHEMGTVPGVTKTRGVRTFLHQFIETSDYALIDISHNGYVYTEDPTFHRRRVLRLEPDIYLIDDQITGLGEAEHDFRLYFNFAPGRLRQNGAQRFDYQTEKGTAYGLTALCDKPVQPNTLCGSEDPIGGWISYGYPLRVAAPQLWFARKGKAPFRFVTLIAPAGYTATGTVSESDVRLEIRGEKNLTLTIRGDKIEKKEC